MTTFTQQLEWSYKRDSPVVGIQNKILKDIKNTSINDSE